MRARLAPSQLLLIWLSLSPRCSSFSSPTQLLPNPSHDNESITNNESIRTPSSIANDKLRVNPVEILPPGSTFSNTIPGQISIASFNILAPSYHFLGSDENERSRLEAADRQERVPQAIALATQTNADILLLQEVEGGPHESLLRAHLRNSESGRQDGYDAYLWSPLRPNSPDDCVGLAIAWRSEKFQLDSSESFRRGQLVRLSSRKDGATIYCVNLHLFAKPSAVEGRLKKMSATVQRLRQLLQQQPSTRSNHTSLQLDGTVILGGDWNCEPNSVTTSLLTNGRTPYGTLYDRNYRTKLSKASALAMRHPLRFRDAYQDHRFEVADITVSLKGRGPGCMDHLYFLPGHEALSAGSKRRKSTTTNYSKRQSRRQRNESNHCDATKATVAPVRVRALLATIDRNNPQRTQLILDGLPNPDAGFPSDHLPIGVLLEEVEDVLPCTKDKSIALQPRSNLIDCRPSFHGGGQKGTNRVALTSHKHCAILHEKSSQCRQRHNRLVRSIADALGNATHMYRDLPLYKWQWTQDMSKPLTKKTRAPDLCCVLNQTSLVVVEVTVTSQPEHARHAKWNKYRDLIDLLRSSSPRVTEDNLVVENMFVLVFGDDGSIPDATNKSLSRLFSLTGTTDQEYVNETLADLKGILQKTLLDYKRLL